MTISEYLKNLIGKKFSNPAVKRPLGIDDYEDLMAEKIERAKRGRSRLKPRNITPLQNTINKMTNWQNSRWLRAGLSKSGNERDLFFRSESRAYQFLNLEK